LAGGVGAHLAALMHGSAVMGDEDDYEQDEED
jgi:hypothetical protein